MNNDSVAPPAPLGQEGPAGGHFVGLRNRERPERQPYGALADASNMDLTDSLTLERRDGFALAMPLSSATAAYATRDERRAWVIDDGDLLLLRPDLSTVVVDTGFPQGEYHWAEADDLVFFTGPKCGWLRGDAVLPLRVPVPDAPTLTPIAGELPAGLYQAALTLTHEATGLEGSASVPTQTELAEAGALRIVVPALPLGHTGNLYLSSTNGDVLYALVAGLAGGESIEYRGPLIELARPLDPAQANTDPMPDGVTVCEVHEGRLWVAQPQDDETTVLWFSQPGWFHLFNLAADFELYPGRITGLASVGADLVVATTQEVGLLRDRVRNRVTWYGTPAGAPLVKTPQGAVLIWTNRGVVRVPEIANLTEQKVSLAPGSRCAAAYVERHGREQLIVCTDTAGWAANPY